MPDFETVLVPEKKLPYINNDTLQFTGFFSRRRNKNTPSLLSLPEDLLKIILNKLSADELKNLAATSSHFLKMMMKPTFRSNGNKVYYPYLQEIYVGDIVSHIKKQGVYDELIKRFLDRDDPLYAMDSEKAEQALRRIIKLKPECREKCVGYIKRTNKYKRPWMLAITQFDDVLVWPIIVVSLTVFALGLICFPAAGLGALLLAALVTEVVLMGIAYLISEILKGKRNQFYSDESPFENLDDNRDSTITKPDTDDNDQQRPISQLCDEESDFNDNSTNADGITLILP